MSITALQVTSDVLRDVVTLCRAAHPKEACGFIIGTPTTMVGRRVVAVDNIHPTPTVNYRMADNDVVRIHHQADDAGEEVIAVFHSHTDSPPILSSGGPDKDVENAHDIGLAYLVVSTRNLERPTARAWRINLPFVGVREAEEIPLRPVRPEDPLGPSAPVLPWALTPGNQVEISYRRFRGTGTIVMQAEITHGGAETVFLNPRLKSGVNSLPVERILSVRVLIESAAAQDVRREAIACLRHAAAALSSGDVNLVEQLIAVPAAAFPATIETSIR